MSSSPHRFLFSYFCCLKTCFWWATVSLPPLSVHSSAVFVIPRDHQKSLQKFLQAWNPGRNFTPGQESRQKLYSGTGIQAETLPRDRNPGRNLTPGQESRQKLYPGRDKNCNTLASHFSGYSNEKLLFFSVKTVLFFGFFS